MKQFKIVVEKHPDPYVAYPLGLKGVVVGEGGGKKIADFYKDFWYVHYRGPLLTPKC